MVCFYLSQYKLILLGGMFQIVPLQMRRPLHLWSRPYRGDIGFSAPDYLWVLINIEDLDSPTSISSMISLRIVHLR